MSTTQNLLSAQVKTLPITVGTSASASTALPSFGDTIRIFNEGPNDAFISVGAGAQVATLPNATPTATSVVCPAREDLVFSIPNTGNTSMTAPGGAVIGDTFPAATPLNISAICRTGTALLDVSVGMGC